MFCVVANKIDLENSIKTVSSKDAINFASVLQVPLFFASAQEGVQVTEAFTFLVQQLLLKRVIKKERGFTLMDYEEIEEQKNVRRKKKCCSLQ